MRKYVRGGGGCERFSHLSLDLVSDPDLWKILWIRIRQNDADPSDPDPQHCFKATKLFLVAMSLPVYKYGKSVLKPRAEHTSFLGMSQKP